VIRIRLDDNGWTLRLTVEENGAPVDVSGIILADAFILIPPKGANKLADAVFTTDGTDGQVEYVVEPGDFDQVGEWRVLVHFRDAPLDLKSSAFVILVQRTSPRSR